MRWAVASAAPAVSLCLGPGEFGSTLPVENGGSEVDQTFVDRQAAEQPRALLIECDAARTRLAIALFALLDARAEATATMEQSRELHGAITLMHERAASWLPCVFR